MDIVEDLPRRQTPPKALGLNKNMLLVVISALAVLIIIALLTGLTGSSKEKKNADKTKGGTPGVHLAGLPNSYADIPRKPQKVVRASMKPEVIIQEREDKFLSELLKRKLKRKLEAREASPAFNMRLPEYERAGTGSRGAVVPAGMPPANPLANLNPRDAANRQDEKREFLNSLSEDSEYLRQRITEKRSDFTLSAGTIIPGVLLTGINSDLPGKITGQVRSNVYDSASGQYLLIPQGTRIVGDYDSKVSYGQERVLIVWRRLLFPDGSSINIENMPGVDAGGYSGLKDKVNNHYGRILTGVVIGSLIGAGAQMATGREYSTSDPNFGELAGQGAAKEINQVTQRITDRNLNIQPTLEIRPGSKFSIFVTKDVFLRAYG